MQGQTDARERPGNTLVHYGSAGHYRLVNTHTHKHTPPWEPLKQDENIKHYSQEINKTRLVR